MNKQDKAELKETIKFYYGCLIGVRGLKLDMENVKREKKFYTKPDSAISIEMKNDQLNRLQQEKCCLELRLIYSKRFVDKFESELEKVKLIHGKDYYDMFHKLYIERLAISRIASIHHIHESSVSRKSAKVAATLFENIQESYEMTKLKLKEVEEFQNELAKEFFVGLD